MSLLGPSRDGTGPVVVWLHGFTQTRDSARRFRTILAGEASVVTVDLPGHGANADHALSLPATADALAAVLPDEPFVLGGYSLGGRVALHFALAHPRRVRALALLGATRGIADDAERRQRRERDELLATHAEEIGIEAFLDEWLAQPLFGNVGSDADERSTRSRDVHGLAQSLRHMGTGTQEWLGERLSALTTPVVTLAGAFDEKFMTEGRAIADSVTHGAFQSVADAHHAAHLENPEAVVAAIVTLLGA